MKNDYFHYLLFEFKFIIYCSINIFKNIMIKIIRIIRIKHFNREWLQCSSHHQILLVLHLLHKWRLGRRHPLLQKQKHDHDEDVLLKLHHKEKTVNKKYWIGTSAYVFSQNEISEMRIITCSFSECPLAGSQ